MVDTHYQVIIPLRTRFETVGSLVVSSNTAVVSNRLRTTFEPLVYLALGLSVIFAADLCVCVAASASDLAYHGCRSATR